MNANAAYLATAERRTTARFTSPARNAPARPADLAGLVERWVRHGHESDSIFRGAERAFPPPDPTPAGRRGYRETIARLIVRYRHGADRGRSA